LLFGGVSSGQAQREDKKKYFCGEDKSFVNKTHQDSAIGTTSCSTWSSTGSSDLRGIAFED